MGFEQSLVDGALGELIVADFLSQKFKSVVDVRRDYNFQQMDVDFLVEDNLGQYKWVEVKTDFSAHETGKMVYELSTSNHIGCFEKTKAQWIAYYVAGSGRLYMISVKKLREYVRQNTDELTLIKMGDNAKGYLLDIGTLEFLQIIDVQYATMFLKDEG